MQDVMQAQSGPSAKQGHRRRARRLMHVAGAVLLLAALDACAGARVSDVSSANAAGPRPTEILVQVSAATPASAEAEQAKLAGEVAAKLQAELVQNLTEARVTAEPFVSGTSHPGAAVLHVTVSQVDPGSAIARFVIGFGAGRAELQVAADLANADTAGAQSVTAFSASANSGRAPGLILPGGVALATRNWVHLAIGGGIKVALSLNDGLDKPVKETSKAIVKQVGDYYKSAGWYWPAEVDSALLSRIRTVFQ
jgi:Domain of unknown function (DUF4410)